jgi:ABC-type branched-subunit amino acid transport system substrate-binding protein
MKRLGYWVIGLMALGLLGLGCAREAAKKDTVVIGFTASQTGSLNVEGMRQINGLKLWVDQVNAGGGIKLPDGRAIKVEIKYYDDESKKDRVQELYTKLVSQDKANFLISPYSSGLTDAAAVMAQQYNRVMITAGAASDSTHAKGYTLVYQTYTPASRYLVGAIDLLTTMDPQGKKIAIVYEKDKFSTDVVNALKVYAEKKGDQVVLFEGYGSGTSDFAPFINKIPAAVDAVMGGGHYTDTTTFARQIHEKRVKTKMAALLVAPPEPKFGAELGEAAMGVVGPSQWDPLAIKYSAEAAKAAGVEWFGPSVPEFVAAYKAKYNENPSYHSAGGYAAGLILQRAIQQAGSTETAKVKAALDKTDIFTFYGRVKFDTGKNHGLQIGHEMVYNQWQKDSQGKLVNQLVWPADFRTAPPVFYSK